MDRTQITSGVFINDFKEDAKKFKRCRISISFILPGELDTATAYALLPYVMERGYEDCPDMTALSIKLSSLYGAELSSESTMQGANRVVTIAVSGIKDEYVPNGEKLSPEYTKLLLGVATRPYLEEGIFPKDAVLIESQKLKDLLESEQNNKRSYCVRQARRRFFGSSKNGIESNGYIDKLEAVTPELLTKAYTEMLLGARIEISVLGADCEAVKAEIKSFFENNKREYIPFIRAFPEKHTELVSFEESISAVQGKLCIIYNGKNILDPHKAIVMRLATAIFGSLPTSRLFTNVRENQGLCYYCSAKYSGLTATLVVDSGIEHCNAEVVKKAIEKEFETLQKIPIEQGELDDAKRQIINQLNSLEDSLCAIDTFNFFGILKQDYTSVQETKEIIAAVTSQEILELLQDFTPVVSYLLTL